MPNTPKEPQITQALVDWLDYIVPEPTVRSSEIDTDRLLFEHGRRSLVLQLRNKLLEQNRKAQDATAFGSLNAHLT